MNDISRVIRQAAFRLGIARFLEALVWLAVAVLIAAALGRIAEKLGVVTLDWSRIAMYAPAGVIVMALVYSLVRRMPALAVARRVDEGAGLRDSLSTALHVGPSQDPWARNVVEYAQRAAIGVNVKHAVPIAAPRRWPAVLIAAFAFLMTWLLPQWDILSSRAKADLARKEQQKTEQVKAEAEQAVNKIKEAVEKLDPGLKKDSGDDKKLEGEKPKPLTAEQIQRAAIKELSSMKDRLEQIRDGAKAKTAETLADKMRELKTGAPGPLDKMAQAMGQGDFAKAKEQLQEMAKSLSSGEMSAEQKAAMEKQLQNMANQLDKMAADKKELENKLAAAGLDPKLAGNPEAMKKAMENLSPEQKSACENASQAAQNAGNQCESMSQAMSQLAQAMQKSGSEGQQQMADAAQQLADQLSQAELAQQELQAAEAALSECKNQLEGMCDKMGEGNCNGDKMGDSECNNPGTKPFSEGELEGRGAGRGGPGISAGGGDPGEAAAQEKWSKRKSRSPLGNGPMIGSMMIQGEQVKGESKAQFKEVIEAANKQAADQVTNNVVPREYQEVVKGYFSDLAKKAGSAEFKAETKLEAKPEAKPAETKK